MFKKIKLNLFILVFSFILFGCISDVDENNNRNYDLYSKIMCPVCDGQTIGESQASIANDMKKIIGSINKFDFIYCFIQVFNISIG